MSLKNKVQLIGNVGQDVEFINNIPLYLTKWSGGWAFGEIYIYDYREKKFTYHFFPYCPYEKDNREITDLRQKIAQNFSDHHKYLMLEPINEHQNLSDFAVKLPRLGGEI